MPSALNSLLKQFDSLAYDSALPPEAKRDAITGVLKGIDKLLNDPDFEVNRDLFDGVSADGRRIVIAGFVAQLSITFKALRLIDIAESVLGSKDSTGESGPSHDTTGESALDKALRNQRNERN